MQPEIHAVPEPPEELLRCFDAQNNEVEPRTRKWLKDNSDSDYRHYYNGVGSVWVINTRGEILCSKRSATLYGNPGKWQTYFGGKVPVGSTPKETAVREMGEEVGMYPDTSDLFVVQEDKRIGRYIYAHDDDISALVFPDGEIVAARWLRLDVCREESRLKPDEWCNGINDVQEERIRQWMLQHLRNTDGKFSSS